MSLVEALAIDRQVINWLKEMMGYPAEASGTLVSDADADMPSSGPCARSRSPLNEQRRRAPAALLAFAFPQSGAVT